MNIKVSLDKLKEYLEKECFKGFDPYDALNSPILKTLTFEKKFLRIAFIQIMKRLPLNVRPFLGIKKGFNPKGIGLFLWGFSKLYNVEREADYLKKIDFFLELLDNIASKGYSGYCWGYNFDWQSKAFYIPKHTPTIVNSSFVGHALIDTYTYAKKEKALEMAISIKDFILYDLNRKEEDSSLCFSYSPVDNTAVHNANLLGASLLIRIYKYTGERILKDTAFASLAYSMKYQRENGSWPYAETRFQSWIDSFHTGFNLQSILYFLEEGFGMEYEDAFYKGVNFYTKNFFLDNGTPKYYCDRLYPIDIHSAAEALIFFSRLRGRYKELAEKIFKWMIDNMQDKNGFFYFQKKRRYVNKIPYIRWSQAWAFHALTEYLFCKGE